jgi:hypothetical protein
MTLQTCMLGWGFDLEKCLLPIGQCDQLMFRKLLGDTNIDALVVNFDDNTFDVNIEPYYISLYNTGVGTLIITIQNEDKGMVHSSVYTISKKTNGNYFILVNHKNRNRIECEYVETFTWSDSEGNLKEIRT